MPAWDKPTTANPLLSEKRSQARVASTPSAVLWQDATTAAPPAQTWPLLRQRPASSMLPPGHVPPAAQPGSAATPLPSCPSACHGSFPAITSARTDTTYAWKSPRAPVPEPSPPHRQSVGRGRVGLLLQAEAAQGLVVTGGHKVLGWYSSYPLRPGLLP